MENHINISYGKSAFQKLQEKLSSKQYSSVFVLVDNNTKAYCLNLFFQHFTTEVRAVLSIIAGEENKNLATCENLWKDLSSHGADRNSVLINLGGGVVTDLGGFVACTYKRGIDFYNIPTTLLGMVDASVGGKTGIDLGSLKNQIGIIREPQGVIIETDWLKTLPQQELRSGFAEMLKHGLIINPIYWNKLKKLDKLTPEVLKYFVKQSIIEKTRIVKKDPYEKGLRKILNFGHTLGHAIESFYLGNAKNLRLLHGEAIAVGMVLEAYLSSHCSGLNMAAVKEIKKTFDCFYPKVNFTIEDQAEILNLLNHDKKNKDGRINFVLLKAIGQTNIDVEVPKELFRKAFEFYQSA